MATTHEIIAAKDGQSFISVGPVTIKSQSAPRVAKNGRFFGMVVLKSAAGELLMMLWDDVSLWKLPADRELNLQGSFVKASYNGSAQITSDNLIPPEGSERFKEPTAQATTTTTNQPTNQATMKECLDAGLRAVNYVEKKERPDLAAAAFAFAARAMLDGVRLE